MEVYIDNLLKGIGFVMFIALVVATLILAWRSDKVSLFNHDHPESVTIVATDY